ASLNQGGKGQGAVRKQAEAAQARRPVPDLVQQLVGRNRFIDMESAANRQSVGIVLPPVWAQVFLTQARLLQYTLEDLGFRTEVVEYDGRLCQDRHVIL